MPDPIRTPKTIGVYGAPRGLEESIGGLPFWRHSASAGAVRQLIGSGSS